MEKVHGSPLPAEVVKELSAKHDTEPAWQTDNPQYRVISINRNPRSHDETRFWCESGGSLRIDRVTDFLRFDV